MKKAISYTDIHCSKRVGDVVPGVMVYHLFCSRVRSRYQNLYLPTYVPLEARINCFITLLVEINFSPEAKLVLPMP